MKVYNGTERARVVFQCDADHGTDAEGDARGAHIHVLVYPPGAPHQPELHVCPDCGHDRNLTIIDGALPDFTESG